MEVKLIYHENTKAELLARNKSELLAPIIGKQNSQRLLECFPTFNEISRLTDYQIKEKLPKISDAKISLLRSAFKLGSAMRQELVPKAYKIDSPEDIANLVAEEFRGCRNEKLVAVYMNSGYDVIEIRVIAEGGPDEVFVDTRKIFEPALRNNATIIATAHNHPGASPFPSKSDEESAKALRIAAEALDMKFYDEVIIGNKNSMSREGYCSLVEFGILEDIRL